MDVNLSNMDEEPCSGNCVGFANSVTVWLNKPHVVNRRLCGSRLEYFEIVSKDNFSVNYVAKIIQKLGLMLNGCSLVDLFKNQSFTTNDSNEIDLRIENNSCIEGLENLTDKETAVIVRQLLPKQPERHANIPELAIFGEFKFIFKHKIFNAVRTWKYEGIF